MTILLYAPVAAAGYLISGLFGWLGLARRGLSSTGWVLASIPIHWLLLSLAAWRALCQLFVAPYKWEKTEHGLARNSRRNPAAHAARRTRVERQARNTSGAPRLLPAAA